MAPIKAERSCKEYALSGGGGDKFSSHTQQLFNQVDRAINWPIA